VCPAHQRPDQPAPLVLAIRRDQLDLAGRDRHAAEDEGLVEQRGGGDDPVAVDHHRAGRPTCLGIGHHEPMVDRVRGVATCGEQCTDLVEVVRGTRTQDQPAGQGRTHRASFAGGCGRRH
jgi:hypothetical protein